MSNPVTIEQSNATESTTCIPNMKWSQTRDNVCLILQLRSHSLSYTPVVNFEKQHLTIDISTNVANYHVCSELFAAIDSNHSKWMILPNGHLQIKLAKGDDETNCVPNLLDSNTNTSLEQGDTDVDKEPTETYRYSDWWDHPFHQRTYNSFVQIDWSRWEDEPEDLGEGTDDDRDDEYPDLGPLSNATAADLGGEGATGLPNESGNMFQEMLSNLGKNQGGDLPDLSALTKDLDLNKMQDMLKSFGSGDMTDLDGLKDIDLEKMGEVLQSLGADDETDEESESNDEHTDEDTGNREADDNHVPVSRCCEDVCDNLSNDTSSAP